MINSSLSKLIFYITPTKEKNETTIISSQNNP